MRGAVQLLDCVRNNNKSRELIAIAKAVQVQYYILQYYMLLLFLYTLSS